MALPAKKYYRGAPATAVLTSSPSSGDTTMTVDTVTGWPTSFPFYAVIAPGTAKEEKVKVTAVSTLTLTVVRSQDNTTAPSSHASGSTIYPVFTALEASEANEIASVMTTKGDLITNNGTDITRLAVGGTNGHVLQVDSAATNGIKWGQVPTAGIADDAVTLPKLAFDLTGAITAFGGSSAPTGWLLCDGTNVSRSTYADLFAVIGTTYGSGDGSTTFGLPDLKGRVPVGRDSGQTEFDTLGETGGAKTHTLLSAEMPAHVHTVDHDHPAGNTSTADLSHTHTYSGTTSNAGSHSHSISITDPGHQHPVNYSGRNGTGTLGYAVIDGTGWSSTFIQTGSATTGITASSNTVSDHSHTFSGTTAGMSAGATHNHTFDVAAFTGNSGSTGGGGAHNNLQPYIVVNYIIKT